MGHPPGTHFPRVSIPLGRRAGPLGARRPVGAPGGRGSATAEAWSSLTQTGGEHDQGKANDNSEATDKGRHKRHIGISQYHELYVEEHRQGAASSQQPPIIDPCAQEYGGEYFENAGQDGPSRDDVDQAACGQSGPEDGHRPSDDTHRRFGQRKCPLRAPLRGSEPLPVVFILLLHRP
jgi:hypothetical protein